MKIKCDIENIDVVMKNVKLTDEAIKKALVTGVEKAAAVFRESAKGNTPVKTGQIKGSLESAVTWCRKDAPKAYAGVGVNEAKAATLRGKSKRTGKDYSIPSAVEYGHRAPGGGGYTVLATDKEGNFVTYKKGKKKGQLKSAANKFQNKVAKPVRYMKKAYDNKTDRQRAVQIIEGEVRAAIAKAGGFYARVSGGGN